MSASPFPTPSPLGSAAIPRTKNGHAMLWQTDLDAYDPRPQRSGERIRYRCLIHGGDHQKSLSVDPRTGVFHCHACGESGTLRDFWPARAGGDARASRRPTPRRAPTVEDIGRQIGAERARADATREARLAASPTAEGAAFLALLPEACAALRDPACPGAVYLRGRGLDPLVAADLGVGYVGPNVWPSDTGQVVGRIVYPLADPATGRLVSALGRLCTDPTDAWPPAKCAAFKKAKQRKLTGCASGVWPYEALDRARVERRPLALVEGPADALALAQCARAEDPARLGGGAPPALALLGTEDALTRASVRGLAGVVVVLALDADDAGRRATSSLRATLGLAGVVAAVAPAGWLGGAKDAGALAARVALAATDAERAEAMAAYTASVQALDAARARVGERPTLPHAASPPDGAWSDEDAHRALNAFYNDLAAEANAYTARHNTPWPPFEDNGRLACAIDAACEVRQWPRVQDAIAACLADYRARLAADEATSAAATSPPEPVLHAPELAAQPILF